MTNLLKSIAKITFTTAVLILFPALGAAQTKETASNGSPGAEKTDDITTASFDQALLRELIVEYTNKKRKAAGLSAVEADDALSSAAEQHSKDMARRDYFSHTAQRENKPDISFEEREAIKALGYKRTAENISLQPVVESSRTRTRTTSSGDTRRTTTRNLATYNEMARNTVSTWMESPGHRKNILTPEFRLIGIGSALGQQGGQPYVYITQLFGQK